jgi:hypothetical protein
VRGFRNALVAFVTGALAVAQAADIPKYENRNMVDYGPLVFRGLAGQATDPSGVPVPGASVALFTKTDHKLVASAVTDESGRFRLPHVSRGRFRVVVHFDSFCPANVPVSIVWWPRGGIARKLQIHLSPDGIDSCSFGAYK